MRTQLLALMKSASSHHVVICGACLRCCRSRFGIFAIPSAACLKHNSTTDANLLSWLRKSRLPLLQDLLLVTYNIHMTFFSCCNEARIFCCAAVTLKIRSCIRIHKSQLVVSIFQFCAASIFHVRNDLRRDSLHFCQNVVKS